MKLNVWSTDFEYALLISLLEATAAQKEDADKARAASRLLKRITAAKHTSGSKKRT